MDFYDKWSISLNHLDNNKSYIKRFLNKDPESLKVFNNGTPEELTKVCKFLLDIPIDNFIYCIDEDIDCNTNSVIQYSNLYHAIVDVPRVLKFSHKSLTFSELGKILINAKNEGARKKYGENHSKLAEELSMVSLEKKGSTYVTNTSFGDFSVSLSDDNRKELVKRMMLRNIFIRKIIFYAKEGKADYTELLKPILSNSTLIRRKSNVRQVVNLILEDKEELKNRIVW